MGGSGGSGLSGSGDHPTTPATSRLTALLATYSTTGGLIPLHPPADDQWVPIVHRAKRAMVPQEFLTVYRQEPVRYTTIEAAEVFPTQPYSKIVRGYPMIHPEQINTTMVRLT